MKSNTSINHHFSTIADVYQEQRITDTGPIDYILSHLQTDENLDIIDLGCGTGRYDKLLLDGLDKSCTLTGVDANEEMLIEFTQNLKSHGYPNIKSICNSIANLPNSKTSKYDALLSFNALHHFNLGILLTLISKLLQPNSSAFLYTRTRTQNQLSIWGKYFPQFDYYENRLLSLSEIEKAIYKTNGIELKEIKFFKYYRSGKLDKLIEQVTHRHYSTFSIYSPDELENATKDFEETIENKFDNLDEIDWIDRNVMFWIQRT